MDKRTSQCCNYSYEVSLIVIIYSFHKRNDKKLIIYARELDDSSDKHISKLTDLLVNDKNT